MGIHRLMNLLKKNAPECITKISLENLSGCIIACDAPIAIHQFLNARGSAFSYGLWKLTDLQGNNTGHLVGILNRTLKFIQNGVKPIWIFDGKAPLLKTKKKVLFSFEFVFYPKKKIKNEELKNFELEEDEDLREENIEEEEEFIVVTKKMIQDCKIMLELIGIPVIEAHHEAEAECAALVKAGLAYATVSEDMDALAFGTNVLLRGCSNINRGSITSISLSKMLASLNITYKEFVDLCILCGCDYTSRVRGIGAEKALKLIQEYKNIEKVLEKLESDNKNIKKKKNWTIPKFFDYQEARNLFVGQKFENLNELTIEWKKPKESELIGFLVEEKGFAKTRVIDALNKYKYGFLF